VDSNYKHTVAVQWRIAIASFRIFTDDTLKMVARCLQEKLTPLVLIVNCSNWQVTLCCSGSWKVEDSLAQGSAHLFKKTHSKKIQSSAFQGMKAHGWRGALMFCLGTDGGVWSGSRSDRFT
jgi:hypothetical protein